MSKFLVAYFSTGGNTRRAAKALAGVANAELYEIQPVQTYSHADLNWMDKHSRSTIEMNDDLAAGRERLRRSVCRFPHLVVHLPGHYSHLP